MYMSLLRALHRGGSVPAGLLLPDCPPQLGGPDETSGRRAGGRTGDDEVVFQDCRGRHRSTAGEAQPYALVPSRCISIREGGSYKNRTGQVRELM
mmetsp:Transcript_15538/g.36924  ORF Transcript_15538/g.36924 Transcript_15538/m.36924 type:complete len:95 (+) Transcript_15538:664-948(+)